MRVELNAPLAGPVATHLTDRIRRGELPRVVYAVVGAAEAVGEEAGRQATAIAEAPHRLVDELRRGVADVYEGLVSRGQDRVVEIGADRAVRNQFSKVEDRWAPRATRWTVRYHEQAERFRESPTRERAVRARAAMRRSADRFSEMNAPIMLDDESKG